MKDFQQPAQGEDPEATLVTPRFGEEETVLAQPVVPLADVGPGAGADEAAPVHAPTPAAPRRSWLLVLVLVSAFAGSVIGGAGLYLYQKGRRAPQQPPAETTTEQQPAAPAETSQAAFAEPSPEAPAEAAEPPAPDAETEAKEERLAPKPAPEVKPAADRQPAPDATRKRGKKGEHENDARDEDDDGLAARRVDSIIYPTRREQRRAERRAARRAERQQSRVVDRVRGIFEGQPQ